MKVTHLYFAQPRMTDAIKVGITSNIAQRLKTLHADLRFAVELDWFTARTLEQGILEVFAAERLAGEYLSPVPALVALIELAKNGGAEAIRDELARLRDAATVLPPEFSYDPLGVVLYA